MTPDDETAGSRPAHLWHPDAPDSKIPALYHVSAEDGGVEIELLDALVENRGTLHVPVLHANVAGRDATLFDCHLLSSTGGGWTETRPTHQRWWVRSAVENGLFPSEAEARFDRAEITSPHLARWAGRETVTWDFDRESEGEPSEFFRWKHLPPETAAVPGAAISLATGVGWDDRAFGDKTIRQRHVFTIETDEPLPYDEVWGRFVRPLRDLLSLAVGEAAPMDVLNVRRSSDDLAGHSDGYTIRRHSKRTPTTDFPNMLWTMRDWDFAAGVAKWFDIDAATPAGTMLLSATQDKPGGWGLASFLSAVGAAEALHRGLYDTSEPTAHQKRRLASIYSKVTSDQRKWLKWKLRHSHEPTLQERLVEIVQDTGHPAWRFIPRPDPWAKDIVDARNALAHGRQEAVDVARDPVRLSLMTETLVAALALRLMRELSFDENRTSELTVHQMRWWAEAAARLDG